MIKVMNLHPDGQGLISAVEKGICPNMLQVLQYSSLQFAAALLGAMRLSVARPTVWNSLPDHWRDPAVDSEHYWWDLKTYLFVRHSKR